MTKYIICCNFDKDWWGKYVPGLDCRNVSLHELTAYYYWPGDVMTFFLEICQHGLPDTISFSQDGAKIMAKMTWEKGKRWICFQPVNEEHAKKEGYIEMRMDWIAHLRQDLKNGTRTLLNGQPTK